jgi:hypothetical protein
LRARLLARGRPPVDELSLRCSPNWFRFVLNFS